MRTIKFRGKRVDNGELIEGGLVMVCDGETLKRYPCVVISYNHDTFDWEEVIPETVGQFTGLTDKNGKEIFEGDVVRYRRPYRTTQTHTGDNIPNGSYTEPMEPAIKTVEETVVLKDGMFCLESEIIDGYPTPLAWMIPFSDEESIKSDISVHRDNWSIWDDKEEGDLQYLLEEYRLENLQQLIDYVSGIEVIGNIHENPTQP